MSQLTRPSKINAQCNNLIDFPVIDWEISLEIFRLVKFNFVAWENCLSILKLIEQLIGCLVYP